MIHLLGEAATYEGHARATTTAYVNVLNKSATMTSFLASGEPCTLHFHLPFRYSRQLERREEHSITPRLGQT